MRGWLGFFIPNDVAIEKLREQKQPSLPNKDFMISASDFIHLPFTRDLIEGGIAYAVRSLPYLYNHKGRSSFERLRRIVAGVSVELAFRRYLSEHQIPFDVMGAAPFTDPDHYDVSLAGRRCAIQFTLLTHREQIAQIQKIPDVLLKAPALVPSDQNAAEGHLNTDIYLFAFLTGLVTAKEEDIQKVIQSNQPRYFMHVMPEAWRRPVKWNPLGTLVLKSASEESLLIEIGGQNAGREMRSFEIVIPPKTRILVDEGLYSLTHLHTKSMPDSRIGIHSLLQKETHIIDPSHWENIWVYGKDILLAGYLTREEFNRRAAFLREGARVFPYDRTRTKNLAVSVSDLKPISELFDRVKEWSSVNG